MILKANIHLAVQQSINAYIIQGLRQTIVQEKKRRKRGKRLNLIGEEESGPQFFGPAEVEAARVFQAKKETDEDKRKQAIANKKALAVVAKERVEAAKKERAIQLAIRREEAVVLKAQKIVDQAIRKAEREACKAKTIANKAEKTASKLLASSTKAQVCRKGLVDLTISGPDHIVAEPIATKTTTGRKIVKPARYA